MEKPQALVKGGAIENLSGVPRYDTIRLKGLI
jgi:hypothetical protein